MKKIYSILLLVCIGTSAFAQLPWQLKCDISAYTPYGGGMQYFAFKANNPSEGLIMRGDSLRTTTNSGQTWGSPKPLPKNGIFGVGAIGYSADGSTIFASNWKKIYKSVDGGNTFTLVTDTLKYEAMCYAVKGNFIAFGFEACAIAYSKDGGITWVEKRIKNIASSIKSIHIISDNVVLVSATSTAFYTKDGGDTWTEYVRPQGAGTLAEFYFTGIDENNWFITFTDGNQYLFRTTDGGNTWDDLITNWGGTNLSLRHLYATTDGKLLAALPYQPNKPAKYRYSLDAGQTWTLDSLDASTVSEIAGFRQSGNTLYALAQYISTPVIRKIYALDLGGGSTSVSEVSPQHVAVELYPNPASSFISIESDEEIEAIQITDVAGKLLMNKNKVSATSIQLSIAELTNATYFIHIKTTGGKSVVKRFVKN
jgi:photosystem II stability/assembly factor-like uncharacterized protein